MIILFTVGNKINHAIRNTAVYSMNKKWLSAMYALNIIFQSFFSLASPIALALALGWLTVAKLGAPTWVYVPFTVVGVFSGLFSMVKFILSAMGGLNRLEKEQEHSARDKERRQATDLERKKRQNERGDS